MALYSYDGPVMYFDVCVNEHWKGQTEAPSEAKAKSNLTFQYKKKNNMTPDTRVSLPGKLVIIG